MLSSCKLLTPLVELRLGFDVVVMWVVLLVMVTMLMVVVGFVVT